MAFTVEPFGQEFLIAFGPKAVTNHNLAALRNSDASRLMLVRQVWAYSSNAVQLFGRGVKQASLAGTSAGVVAASWYIQGRNIALASVGLPGKPYYGCTTVATGITCSSVLTPDAFRGYLGAGQGGTIAEDIMVAPGYALVLRAQPTAKGAVSAWMRVRWLPTGVW